MDSLTAQFLQTFQKTKLSFKELFPDDFILRKTHFSSLEDFLNNTGFVLTTQEELEQISTEKWDQYIKSCSQYNSFEEMKSDAVQEWIEKEVQKIEN